MTSERLAELEKADSEKRIVILPHTSVQTLYAVWARTINDWYDVFSVERSEVIEYRLQYPDRVIPLCKDPKGGFYSRLSDYYDTKQKAQDAYTRLLNEGKLK